MHWPRGFAVRTLHSLRRGSLGRGAAEQVEPVRVDAPQIATAERDPVAVEEFKKEKATSVAASILMRADEHGYKSTEMLYQWIKDGKEPPLDTRTAGLVVNRENFTKEFKEKLGWIILVIPPSLCVQCVISTRRRCSRHREPIGRPMFED